MAANDLDQAVQRDRLSGAFRVAPAAPVAPKPQEPGVGDYAQVGFRALASTPRAIASGIISTVQGQAGVEAPGQEDAFEKFVRETDKQAVERQQQVTQQFPESVGIQALSRLDQQIGFSAPATIAGIAAGVATAPTAAVTGGAGPFIAGGATAGGVAYRGSSGQIMRTYIDALDEEKRASSGVGLTPEETQTAKENFATKATEYGLWEALPEAVGGAVAGRLIFGPLKKIAGEKLATSMLGKLGSIAGVVGEELATETVTQVGQSQTLAGTELQGAEQPLQWTPEGLSAALKEVAPDTLLLTALTGGVLKGGQIVGQRRQEVKAAKKLGIDRPTLLARVKEVAAYKAANPDAEISNEDINKFLAGAATIDGKPIEEAVKPVAPEATPVAPEATPVTPVEAQATPVTTVSDQEIQDQVFGRMQAAREAAVEPEAIAPTTRQEVPQSEVSTVPEERPAPTQEVPDLRPDQERNAPEVAALATASDEALNKAYDYGLAEPGSFGEAANISSASSAKELLDAGQTDIEALAAAIHEGWATTARTFEGQPAEKKAQREELADTPYAELPEEEKEKDRVAAKAILAEYSKSAQLQAIPATQVAPTTQEAQDAAQGRQVQEGIPDQYAGADVGVQGQGVDRVVAPEVAQAGSEASRSDIVLDEAQEVAPGAPAESALPKLKRGYKRSTFTVSTPSYAGNTFVEDVSPKGKTTLMVQDRNGVVKPASKYVAEQVAKAERTAYEGMPFSEEVATAVTPLIKDIEKKTSQTLKPGTIVEVTAPAGSEAEFSALAKLLNKKLVFFKAVDSPMALNGATNVTEGVIYVNVDSVKPHMMIVGHEFLHNLKRETPELYLALQKATGEIISTKDKLAYWKKLNDKRAKEGAPTMSLAKVEEELIANFFGEQFTSKAFWMKVEKKNPSQFAEIVQAMLDFLDRVKGAFSGKERADIDHARDVAAEALARYVRRNPEAVAPESFEFSDTLDQASTSAKSNLNATVKALKEGAYVTEQLPNILKVTPESIVTEVFKDRIPLLVPLAATRSKRDYVRNDIIDSAGLVNQEILDLADKGVGKKTVEKAAATASFNQMWPQKSLLEQDWVPANGSDAQRLLQAERAWTKAGMDESTGKTFEQAYTQSKRAFDTLKTSKDTLDYEGHSELQSAYLKAVDQMSKLRGREKNNMQRLIEAATTDNPDFRKEQLARLDEAFAGVKGAYWPLYREGAYILEYLDTNGARVVEHFESVFARMQAEAAYAEMGIDPATYKRDLKSTDKTAQTTIPEAYNKQLVEAVEKSFLIGVDMADSEAVTTAKARGAEAAQNMTEIWLRWQPETSALKNSIKRRNVKGHSLEMLRGFLHYSQAHGSRIAQMEEGRKVEDLLAQIGSEIKRRKAEGVDVVREQAVLYDMKAREEAGKSVRVNKFAQTLGKFTTFWYMTSPSIALVQMTQLGVLTLPKLATMKFGQKGDLGVAKASATITKGIQSAFSPKFSRDAMYADDAVNLLFDDIQATVTPDNRVEGKELGDPVFTEAEIEAKIKATGLSADQQKLLALRTAMAKNLLDISLSHEVGEIASGGDPTAVQSRVFKGMMSFMRISETASRKAAILATFDASTSSGQGFFDAMDNVEQVVNSTLYNYSKEAKGVLLQGSTARVLMTFQTFRIMTAFKIGLLFKQSFKHESREVQVAARKELIGIFGMSGALSGAFGMPFAAIMFKVLDAALSDEDEPYDSKEEFKKWSADSFGETVGDIVTEGPASILGTAISRRIGLGDVFGGGADMPVRLHGDGAAAWWATQMLGPSYSMVAGMWKGADLMLNEGEYRKGLEYASPKPMKDMLKAYGLATDGLKTGIGKRLMSPDEIGINEILLMALGFQPLEVSKVRDKEFAVSKMSTLISTRRGQIVQDFAKAFNEDGDTTAEKDAIFAFNSKWPEFGIGAKDLRSRLTAYAKGEAGLDTRREALIRRRLEQ